jgi:diguanylate cyclase (GGDEF)-like protein/PAS domain S-box-containing protein
MCPSGTHGAPWSRQQPSDTGVADLKSWRPAADRTDRTMTGLREAGRRRNHSSRGDGVKQDIDHGRLLAGIAATLDDCILSVGARGTVLWASPATEGLMGWSPDELAGRPVDVVVPPRDGESLASAALGRLLAGEPVAPWVGTAVRRDGSTFDAQLTFGPMPGGDGGPAGAVVVLRDVTDQLSRHRELAMALEVSRAHFDQAPTAQAILDLDGRLESVNPAWCETFGRGEAWFADCSVLDLVAPADTDAVVRRLARLRAGDLDSTSLRCRFGSASGDEIALVLDASLLREPGGRPYAVAASLDADDAEAVGEAAVVGDDAGLVAELHRSVVEATPEGILATALDGSVIFANETAAELLGRAAGTLAGQDPVRLLGLGADGAAPAVQREEVVHRRPDGIERILRVTRRPLSSRDARLGTLYFLSDVTDARHAERRLRAQALHDQLTGLPNRHLFLDRLERARVRQQRNPGRGTAVLFLDVDRLKSINDGFGHLVGDGVLREVGRRLQAAVRATDTVARLGGDEFAVVCEDLDSGAATVVAHRILAALGRPVTVDGMDHEVGVSVGVALAPPYPFDEVVRRADEAMYAAKQSGGHRVRVAQGGQNR